MNAPRQFDTARLTLRRPQAGDAGTIFGRYAGDFEVTRFLGWPRHRSLLDTEAFLRFSDEEWARWPAGPYLIISRADGQLLGSTGLAFQAPHQAVTGYVLARDAWGRGYATEALTGVIGVAARVGVTRLAAYCHPAHGPSRRVLEKCGFLLDAGAGCRLEFPNLAPGVQQEALCFTLTLEPGGDREG